MGSKKGQVPSTITWVVAFIVILFFMVIFNLVSIGLAGKKSVSSSGNFLIDSETEMRSSYKLGELEAYNQLEGFLLSEGRYHNMDVMVYDLIFNFKKGDADGEGFIDERSKDYFFVRNKVSSFGLDLIINEERAGRFGNLVCSAKIIQVTREINDKKIVFCMLNDEEREDK